MHLSNLLKRSPLSLALLLISLTPCLKSQTLIWDIPHGGIYNEGGYAAVQADDGSYMVIGSTYSFGAGEFDLYLLKIGAAGDTLWTRTFGGALTEYGYDIHTTSDGGFILVGSTKSFGVGKKDIYLIKVDSSGNILWQRTYGGAEDDDGWSVRQTSDRGFIICGSSSSSGAGYSDLILIKTDSVGQTLWSKTFGGAGGESGASVRELNGGGFVAVGSTGSFGTGYSSVYLVRTSANGDSLWAKDFGGAAADFGNAVEVALDGSFLIAGATASIGAGYSDFYLLKVDAAGTKLWEKTFGGSKDDRAYSIFATRDGSYILTGTTESYGAGMIDLYAVRVNPDGDQIWARAYGGAKADYGRMVFQDRSRDYILVGYTYSFGSGGSDLYLAKIQGETTPVDDHNFSLLPGHFILFQNYPNPFNQTTIIEFAVPRSTAVEIGIYNLLGQLVRGWTLGVVLAGRQSIIWDGCDNAGREAASGIYFFRLRSEQYHSAIKIALIK